MLSIFNQGAEHEHDEKWFNNDRFDGRSAFDGVRKINIDTDIRLAMTGGMGHHKNKWPI